MLFLLLGSSFSVGTLYAQSATDSVHIVEPAVNGLIEAFDQVSIDDALPQYAEADTLKPFDEDSLAAALATQLIAEEAEMQRVDTYFENFNPKPLKAVWMAALFPGAGQIYNRKYWKLPIIYGGLIGLIYGYNWNQRYYKTYQNAYRDLKNNSPNGSFYQFIRGNNMEAKKAYVERQRSYLESTFEKRKNRYRNYRDYCVVGMIGVYLVSIVDAYVDASLYHFDVSPELDAYNQPSMMLNYTIDF